MRIESAVAIAVLAVSCTLSGRTDPTGPLRPGAATLDDTVAVTLGRSAVTRDGAVRVSFLEKLADSRCPIDAVCVWAGDVGALLRIETLDSAGEGRVHTALDPRRFLLSDYQVSLLDMTPYPGDRSNRENVASVRVLRAPQ